MDAYKNLLIDETAKISAWILKSIVEINEDVVPAFDEALEDSVVEHLRFLIHWLTSDDIVEQITIKAKKHYGEMELDENQRTRR